MIMDFQTLNPLSTQTLIRKATDQDLIHLEWDGEYRHFRKLYQEIYESSKKGDAILWVVELNGSGIIGQVFIQLDSARKDLADGRARAYLYGFRIHPNTETWALEVIYCDMWRKTLSAVVFRKCA